MFKCLLGGGKKLLLGSLIQFQFSYARNWPFGAAMAMFLLALVILVLIDSIKFSFHKVGLVWGPRA